MDGEERDGRIRAYVLLHKLSSLKRTGWVDYGVPNPETVMCHMYDAWILGTIFLPVESQYEGYDKRRILDMLLIHDLAESVTGDIVTPLKDNDPRYDMEEESAMKSILSSISYDSSLESLWDEWVGQATINAMVAKDIDILQSIVQFCLYRPDNPSLQKRESTDNWLGKRVRLRTDIGRGLYDRIVPNLIE